MELYDLLEKTGLINDSLIDKKIMNDWSIPDILDFNEKIESVIMTIDSVTSEDLPSYQFVANSELAGQDYGGCSGIGCRIEKVEELSRFATLWADKVYVHSYFDEHKIKSEASGVSASNYAEIRFRECYVGHIKCLLRLKPLVKSGIVEIIRGGAWVCPHCMEEKINQCDEIKEELKNHVLVLANEYRKKISAKIVKDKSLERSGLRKMVMEVPEEISHHKLIQRVSSEIPEWLERMYRNSSEDVNIGQRELRKLGIPEVLISDLASSVIFSKMLSTLQGLDASLLTNSHLEVQLLNYIANSDENINRNNILQRELACELPLIVGIPLESLLEIRKKEHEAFLVYRDTIRVATNEYISKGSNSEDAKQLYEDIILPKLNSLNLEVKVIKDRAWRNFKIDVGVIVTCGVFGLLSNMLALQIPLLAASGITLMDTAKNLRGALGTPSEIKGNDYYFLWKGSKEAVKKRKIK